MARQALLACLVAGLAVTALAQEACPEKSAYNGCRRKGCVSVSSRRTVELVCDQCGEGYRLVGKGTTRAKCECAPGYAAKGNNGICKACPANTDIAPGGSTLNSECLKCPEGTLPSRDKSECTCAAGHYRVTVAAEEGFAPFACKPCTARTAYITGNNHVSGTCSTCPRGQVANKEHTWCVEPSDPDAAVEGSGIAIPGLNLTLANIQEALQRGRAKAQERMVEQADDMPANPIERLSEIVGGGAAKPAAEAPKLPTLSQVAKGINSTVNELRNFKPSDLAEVAKTLAPGANSTRLQDLGQMVTKFTERVATVLPAMPDPMYVAGLKLDPKALSDADLPEAKNVAELFGKMMRTTIGDLDEITQGDWL